MEGRFELHRVKHYAAEILCALGFLYEMLHGIPPFTVRDRQTMYSRILADEPLCFPRPNELSEDAKDLLRRLLCQSEQRLGGKGAGKIKAQPFFHDLDWDRLTRREYTPAFKPSSTASTMMFSSKKQTARSTLLMWGLTEETFLRMTLGQDPGSARFEAGLSKSVEEARLNGTTDRILHTQFLSLAVNRNDIATVHQLLAEGVEPDFPDSVYPTAHHSGRGHNWSQEYQ